MRASPTDGAECLWHSFSADRVGRRDQRGRCLRRQVRGRRASYAKKEKGASGHKRIRPETPLSLLPYIASAQNYYRSSCDVRVDITAYFTSGCQPCQVRQLSPFLALRREPFSLHSEKQHIFCLFCSIAVNLNCMIYEFCGTFTAILIDILRKIAATGIHLS